MAAASARELLAAAQQSGLLTAADVQQCAAELETARIDSASDAAAQLVQRRTLTEFQVEQLLAGRGDDCVLAGRYRMLSKLGEGAMGAVFQAVDSKLDRPVAIKVLPPDSLHDPDAVARFQREAKALAKLSHANIIQAHDVGEDRGRHFVVMEFVAGTNLQQVLMDQGPLPPGRAADYIYQAALGLKHAHEKGLVHRDLKPSNLLLARDGQIKIADLGLARFLQDQISDPHRTREGMGMGTPDYMPPEQFHDAHAADARADIYSLGCTLYHLLAGRVPFPGSSLSEKCLAHREREPAPLDERCPDAPTGLGLVLSRMMAKRPDDRLQTAAEVAEAIAPYVAGASASSRQIKATASWSGSQVGMQLPRPSAPAADAKRRWAIPLATTAAVIVLLAIVLPRVFKQDNPSAVEPPAKEAAETVPTPADPNVLTVSQDPKQGGQFRTLTEALDQVKPGMIVRVLDDAVYREHLFINRSASQRGITVEAVQRATIEPHQVANVGVTIAGVPGVTLRGFRIRSTVENVSLVSITGRCAGARMDDLDLGPAVSDGMVVQRLELSREDSPLVVENCRFMNVRYGFGIQAFGKDYKTPIPSARVAFRNNRLQGCLTGIAVFGAVSSIQITGNCVSRCNLAGIQLENLHEETADVLVANNTLLENRTAFRLWDESIKGQRIQLLNNLVLGDPTQPDMVFIDSGGEQFNYRGPGDHAKLMAAWQVSHNWREAQTPNGTDILSTSWIPPGPSDQKRDQIEMLSREPGNADFLRPASDSPLATQGAGAEVDDLPAYVGAIAPEGVPAWDWQMTWDARHKHVFTVSQDPKDGGEFRSINAALQKVRPGRTVRVLDSARYTEAISIRSRSQYEGITLESPRRATMVCPAEAKYALVILNVPRVTLQGFRIELERANTFGLMLGGSSPGCTFKELECAFTQPSVTAGAGVGVEEFLVAGDESPAVIENCTFLDCPVAVQVVGLEFASRRAKPCGGVCIRGNRMSGGRNGVGIVGRINDVQVVANQFWDHSASDVLLLDLLEGSGRILVANNSFKDIRQCVEVGDFAKDVRNIEIKNNLLLVDRGPDMTFTGTDRQALAVCQIAYNWRNARPPEAAAPEAKEWVLSSQDTFSDQIELLSLVPVHGDFLRPAADSPLATEGAGKNDPSLPAYIGAVPPQGVDSWDWNKAWKARLGKTAD